MTRRATLTRERGLTEGASPAPWAWAICDLIISKLQPECSMSSKMKSAPAEATAAIRRYADRRAGPRRPGRLSRRTSLPVSLDIPGIAQDLQRPKIARRGVEGHAEFGRTAYRREPTFQKILDQWIGRLGDRSAIDSGALLLQASSKAGADIREEDRNAVELAALVRIVGIG